MRRQAEQRAQPQIQRIERSSMRPSTVRIDILFLTALLLLMVAGTVFCYRRGWIEWGTALAATIPWYVWRVYVYDQTRIIEHTERRYQEPRQRPIVRPTTIIPTDGGFHATYGQLNLEHAQYKRLYRAFVKHPRRRLVIDNLSNDIVPNLRSGGFAPFCRELQRNGWIDEENTLTEIGEHVLGNLAMRGAMTDDE